MPRPIGLAAQVIFKSNKVGVVSEVVQHIDFFSINLRGAAFVEASRLRRRLSVGVAILSRPADDPGCSPRALHRAHERSRL